ncbi:MAG: hypothetical protein ACIARR_04730 [Phycisphaerales bacterium JB059]
MQGRVVLAWVVIAAALAGVYLLTGRAGRVEPREDAARPLLRVPIDPARVERVELSMADGRDASVERAAWSPTGWVAHWTEGGREVAWAVREQRVRGALRALSSSALGVREAGEGEGEVEATWTIRSMGGETCEVALLEGGVGGRRGIRIEGVEGAASRWIGREVAQAFTIESVMAWRDGRMAAGVASGATSLTIEGGGGRVALARSRGSWFVREPVEARAEAGVVEDALARVASLDAGDGGGLWAGADDAEVTALASPLATIEVESVGRVAQGEGFLREVTRWRVEIGGTASGNGATRFVRARRDVILDGEVLKERSLGPVVRAVDVSTLSKLTSRAEAYVSRAPTGVLAADVGVVRLIGDQGEVVFERDRRGWVRGGEAVSVAGETARGIETLLSLACGQAASRVEVLGAVSEVDGRLGEVRFESLGGSVLAAFELGATGTGDALVLREGPVFWISEAPEAGGVVAWVRETLDPRGGGAPPPP